MGHPDVVKIIEDQPPFPSQVSCCVSLANGGIQRGNAYGKESHHLKFWRKTLKGVNDAVKPFSKHRFLHRFLGKC